MSATEIRRGERVVYVSHNGYGVPVEARVERKHRDGDVTVEALFELTEAGERSVLWLGHRYRIDPTQLTPLERWRAMRRDSSA